MRTHARTILGTAVARAVLRTSVAVLGLTLGGQVAGGAMADDDPPAGARHHATTPAADELPSPSALREAERVTRLVRSEGCWTGAAPAGVALPSRALVTLPGGRPRLVRDTVGYEIWLDDRPGILHAFCP